jgi:hypothetical protein
MRKLLATVTLTIAMLGSANAAKLTPAEDFAARMAKGDAKRAADAAHQKAYIVVAITHANKFCPIKAPDDLRHYLGAGTARRAAFAPSHASPWGGTGSRSPAVREYCDDADPRPGKWKLVRRRFVALDKAVIRCFDFVAELGGKVPVGAEPVFKSEQDAHEYVRLGAFIAERALPFIEFWADAVDVVEASGTLTITASDIPRWVDEDTA